ncbi:putative phage-encoded protein [Glaesserella parasuis]|uniref:BRO-N domain-containing protein n=1 Tax=Glaesserella parasuis TaxID=738 RepID=UPI0004DD43B0|nr:Bro-N domain-containing protein [Glaesserella parasuis]KEZ22286.1 putative phage-encoded protein [Glaesserella parasuis]MCT8783586.1 Bro-N domain-containing protein [Glaesserella parasuis]
MSQSTQLSTFNFEQSSIRVITVNNEPWFVAKDVCDTLGIKNPTQALENLDEDERAMFNIGLDQRVNFDNRVSEINIVSESGMYTLILRCRDAVKKGSVPHRFRKWVTAEVLPQIRKTGSYTKSTTDERTGLRQAVSALVSKKGLLYSDAYTLIHQRFNVEHIDELTPEQVGMAVEYVHKIYLEGELIIDEPKQNIATPNDEAVRIAKYLVRARAFAKEVEVFHRKLYEDLGISRYVKNDIAGKAYDIAHEFNVWLDPFIEKTLPQLNQQRLVRF